MGRNRTTYILTVDDKGTPQIKQFAGKSTKEFKKVERAAKLSTENIGKAMAGATVAMTAAFYGISRLVSGMADLGDRTAKTARSLGIGVETLQRFHFVAERSGVAVEAMDKSLQFMIRNTADAADGVGEAQRAFEKLGLSAEKLKLMSPEEEFLAITKAVNQLTNSADRIQVMYQIFGRSGVQLRQITEGGSEAIREMMDRVEDLGGIMSEEGTRKAEEYKDAMLDLETATKGFKIAIASDLIPAITQLVSAETEGLAGLRMWIADLRGVSKEAQLRNLNKEMLTLYDRRDEFMAAPQQDWWRDEFKPRMDAALADVDQKIQELIDKRNKLMTPGTPPPPVGDRPISGDGAAGPAGEEDEVGRFLTKEEEKTRIFAEQLRIRAEMQRERDEEKRQQAIEETDWGKEQAEGEMVAWIEQNNKEAEVEKQRQEESERMRRIESYQRRQAMAATMQNLELVAQTFGKKHKEMFRVMQAMAIAETVVDTYHGAQEAFTALAGIPIVGPALGTAAAAAAIVAGMARVQAISRQKPQAAQGQVFSGPLTGYDVELHGTEVVMPLIRTSSGNLGVSTDGGGGPVNLNVSFHVSALDDESVGNWFERNAGNVSHAIAHELQAGNRGLISTIKETTQTN